MKSSSLPEVSFTMLKLKTMLSSVSKKVTVWRPVTGSTAAVTVIPAMNTDSSAARLCLGVCRSARSQSHQRQPSKCLRGPQLGRGPDWKSARPSAGGGGRGGRG